MPERLISGFRLSPHQKRLWQLQEAEQRQPYRAQCAVVIEGDLNTEMLITVLRRLVSRNEILRTTFRRFPGVGGPLQVITDRDAIALQVCDLTGLDPGQQQSEIEALFEAIKQEPFDLQLGPIARFSLATLSYFKRVLFISLPALCADAVTLNNLVEAIRSSYAACLHGAGQPEERMQYADLAEVFNELLEAEDAEGGRAFWRKKDLSPLSTLKIPFETRLLSGQAFEPEVLEFNLEAELAARLRGRAQDYGASVYDYLLTVWVLLLWRITGQSEVIVGVASDGRSDERVADNFGLLARHVPVQVRLRSESPFSQVLHEMAEVRQEACEWQDYFSWEHLAVRDADMGEIPFAPFCFQFEESPARVYAEDVVFYIHKKYAYFDKFKISLSCAQRSHGLTTEFHFDSALYSTREITRLAAQFHTLVESAVAYPESSIYEMEMLSAEERRQLLAEASDTNIDRPDKCLHELFEDQAARTPDAIAVVCEGEHLDYRSLNSRANHLARSLQTMGAGSCALVAIYVERSTEMVIGLLGILKAGSAYVPLDPAYPEQRISFMLDDTKAHVVVTQRSLIGRLPDCGAHVLCVDEFDGAECHENPPVVTSPESPAYVIYTSGSTGHPKGVIVSHSNVVRLFSSTRDWFGFNENDVWTLFHSYGFDFSVWEIWGALLFGGRLVVVSHLLSRSPETFYDLLHYEGVTVLNQTPSAFRQLLRVEDLGDHGDLSLRFIIFGGEALEFQSLKSWFERHGDERPRLVNMYGITETTVHVTYRPISSSEIKAASGSLIGRALPDLRIYIVDRQGQLTPIGVPGEIYVSGAGLSAGYLNRAELTAERFVPDPFTNKPGSRLYRSGDLASHLSDADIEYVGRIDNQVKIRGFRVELGEIESTLAEHRSVREAVVLARGRVGDRASSGHAPGSDDPGGSALHGDKQIVAYVACDRWDPTTVSDLRRHVEERLPSYMSPSSYVMLRTFPLTVNGKVDRKALPAPGEMRPDLDIPFTAPRTQVEREVAQVWSEFLHVEPIGIYDSFFNLGGHSLLLTQLASRISETFQVDMPLGAFFENPTVAQITSVITAKQAQQRDPGELAEILDQLKRLSPDEVKELLAYEES
jgi:amino acid adenylation domain-containing protein